jgi:hypothetical protein
MVVKGQKDRRKDTKKRGDVHVSHQHTKLDLVEQDNTKLIGTLYRKQRDTRNSSHMDLKSFQMDHVSHISTEMAL